MRKIIDTTEIKESGNFELVEEGIHYARIDEIQESITENGDDMITVKLVIVSGVSQDLWCWDNIVISDNPNSPGYKILGRSKHFLHCINEPYEGKIEVDTDEWIGKKIQIEVYQDEFINKKGRKSKKAKVKNYLISEELQEEDTPFS